MKTPTRVFAFLVWLALALDCAAAKDVVVAQIVPLSGPVGAPAARGGLVYVPFMSQWLEILDGATGKLLTRIRQTDQAVSYVRATPEGVFYGSRGVYHFRSIFFPAVRAAGRASGGYRHRNFPCKRPAHSA